MNPGHAAGAGHRATLSLSLSARWPFPILTKSSNPHSGQCKVERKDELVFSFRPFFIEALYRPLVSDFVFNDSQSLSVVAFWTRPTALFMHMVEK